MSILTFMSRYSLITFVLLILISYSASSQTLSRIHPKEWAKTQLDNVELTANFTDEWSEISVTPAAVNEALESGETIETEIVIANNGNIPLDFSVTIESSGEIYDFGYYWTDSDHSAGPAFIWNDIQNTGTLLTTVSSCDDCNQAVDLTFEFPFYGNKYNKIWVDANGYIGFIQSWSQYWNNNLPNDYSPPAMIAGYWTDLYPDNNSNSKIYFQNYANMVIIQYQTVSLWMGIVTFQIQLYRSGEIRLLYKNVPQYQYYTIGMQNHDRKMGLTISNNSSLVKDNYAIKIASTPGWLSIIEPESGTLAPGESLSINVKLDATQLAEGLYESSLNILSNDSENSLVNVPVSLTVSGYPEIEITDQTVDFGITGLGSLKNFDITITNPGAAALEITDIESTNAVFSSSATELTVPPFESRILTLSVLGTEEITYEGMLNFNTNVKDQENFSIPLKAEVLRLNVLFTITHNDVAVTDATISIYQTASIIHTGNTDQNGKLLVENMYPGTFSYLIKKENYSDKSGVFTITNQSEEISVAISLQYLKLTIAGDDEVFEYGVDDFIPLQIEVGGYSAISYSIYCTSDEYWGSVTSGYANITQSLTIDYDYPIGAFDISGNYTFIMYYSTTNPSSWGQVLSREVEIINNNARIEIAFPDSYTSLAPGSGLYISWKSINASKVNIYYSIDNELTWVLLANDVNSPDTPYEYNDNYYYWVIPFEQAEEDTQCKIRIVSISDEEVFDISDSFKVKSFPFKIVYPTENIEIVAGETLELILDLKSSSWLYFDVEDENSNTYLYFPSEYRTTGIHSFSFDQTQNLRTGKNRIKVFHSNDWVSAKSEFFIVKPATGHNITFSLDMKQAIINDTTTFDPYLHDVYISGTFKDIWPIPGSLTRYKMNHQGSRIYSLNLNVEPGELLYNFYIVPTYNEPTWKYGENDTINCRIATINSQVEIYHTWKNYPIYELKLKVNPPAAGLVFGNGYKPAGHMVTITAMENSDYKFVNWTSENKSVFGEKSNNEFRMPAQDLTLTANFTLSLSSGQTTKPEIIIYPNPADKFVKISSGNIFSEVKIIDKTGKTMQVYQTNPTTEMVIDVSWLAPGMYLLYVISEQTTEFSKLSVIR
jgi:hypothetical protein